MMQFVSFLQAWMAAHVSRDDQGATMVEYGLMLALIAVVCLGVVTTLGTNVQSVFTDIGTSIGNALPA